ncbi:hypothetical protein HPB47_015900 [Ixodes persulcatus]|uniref:Uncharacterized protein n=1 Tax=Ixodes persulcatus TaxID=34615 RepID=A0AC60QVY7_IXOPE|nr:hypothetical protein HPB47_015900 [Ixodes persulcatus]
MERNRPALHAETSPSERERDKADSRRRGEPCSRGGGRHIFDTRRYEAPARSLEGLDVSFADVRRCADLLAANRALKPPPRTSVSVEATEWLAKFRVQVCLLGCDLHYFEPSSLSTEPSTTCTWQAALRYPLQPRGYRLIHACGMSAPGLNSEKMNVEKLFNLLCLYGNVVKIKFLKIKNGAVPWRAVGHQNNAPISDIKMLGYSNQAFLNDVELPFKLPDGTPSFEDFMDNCNNRITNLEAASKKKN